MRTVATWIVCLLLTANASNAQQATASVTTTATSSLVVADTAAAVASEKSSTSTALNPSASAPKTVSQASAEKAAVPPVAPAVTTAPGAPAPVQPAATAVALDDTARNVRTQNTISGDKTPKAATSTVIEESEEDLILDGGEESIIAPAAVPVVQQKQAATIDSANAATVSATVDSGAKIDTVSVGQESAATIAPPVSPMPVIPEAPVVPARIEKIQSINFAKNLKEYRSPKLAIILSLLLPGAGQAYAHDKLQTGIFGVVEAGLIASAAVLAYKGGKKIAAARQYADERYDTASLVKYYNVLMANNRLDTLAFTYDSTSTFLQNARDRNQDYYATIETEVSPYIQGWTDVAPKFDDGLALIDDENGKYFASKHPDSLYFVYRVGADKDTSEAMYGFSEYRKTFHDKLSDANRNYQRSQLMIALLLVNHIISAIDAGITAKAYNDRLLGKSSVWQRINIRDTYVKTGVETVQGYALEVRF